MKAVELIGQVLTNNDHFVHQALDGLSDADLTRRPSDDTNPIGWLLWHQTRVEDATIAAIAEQPQVWIAEGWHAQFGLPDDPSDLGIGHSIEQVGAFAPSLKTLQGYCKAVRKRTLACLPGLSDEDMNRQVTIPGHGTARGKDFLTGMTVDHTQHTGQIAYLRGFFTGKGWFAV